MTALKLSICLFLAGASMPTAVQEASERARRGVCRATATQLALACRLEAAADRRLQISTCVARLGFGARAHCKRGAGAAFRLARQTCNTRTRARLDFCHASDFAWLGAFRSTSGEATVAIAGANRWVYEKPTREGFERVEVEVFDETSARLGLECTVVRDRLFLDGQLVEANAGWLVQDLAGPLWYFVEAAPSDGNGICAQNATRTAAKRP